MSFRYYNIEESTRELIDFVQCNINCKINDLNTEAKTKYVADTIDDDAYVFGSNYSTRKPARAFFYWELPQIENVASPSQSVGIYAKTYTQEIGIGLVDNTRNANNEKLGYILIRYASALENVLVDYFTKQRGYGRYEIVQVNSEVNHDESLVRRTSFQVTITLAG